MVFSLGTAFRSEPVETVLADVVHSARAPEAAGALTESGLFRVRISRLPEAQKRLRIGRTELIVDVPDRHPDTVRYTFDPTRPGSLMARNAADDILQRSAGRQDVLNVSDTRVVQPGGRYIDFLVPGLIGMGLMGGGMWGVGFATVDLRIRRLLKRLVATPMKRSHFLGAMIFSRMLFTIPEVLIILLISNWFFSVRIYGDPLLLGAAILGGALQFSGIGLLIASRATTLETVSGLMNAVMIPMWIASGIFFSPDRFPEYLQPAIRCLPLTPLIGVLRQIMLEGAGPADVALGLSTIFAWGIVTFLLALKLFRWQ